MENAEELRRQLDEERRNHQQSLLELLNAREDVKRTRDMFQLAMDNIPQSIFWKDRQSRFLGCNRAFAEAGGWSSPELLVGLTDYDMACTREEAEFYRQMDAQVMNEDRPIYNLLEPLHRSDGQKRMLETNKIPLRDTQGRVVGILGTYADVTERQELQEELRQHRDHLEQMVIERTEKLEQEVQERLRAEERLAQRAAELDAANRALQAAEKAKSDFFANVSHELRTPLTLILGPLESALANPLPLTLTRALETVHNNALRLLEMVNSLLDFVRLEAGQLEAQREATDVQALTERVVLDFLPTAQSRGQQLVHRLDLQHPVRLVDSYLYERILFNLLSNALKFTPEGRGLGLELSDDGHALHLVVWDEGVGIALADQARLFRRFQQVGRHGGTGLGLSMVRDCARLLGGDVELSSAVGEGTRFTVRLQAPPSEVAAPASPLPVRPRVAPEPQPLVSAPEDAPEVLIAEDNHQLAGYLTELLAPLYRLRWASNGQEALEAVRERLPDLVISDVMMPERDGISLCRSLKEAPATSAVPVMLLTALSLRRSLLEGWEAGADEYLFKPFHPVELLTRVRALIQAGRQHQERLRLEKRLLEAQKEDGLNLMAGGIAHDFNNLLVVILGNLNLAMGDVVDRPEVLEGLREAEAAGQRAAELTRQMLVYSGRSPTQTQGLNLASLVTDTATLAVKGAARSAELETLLEMGPVLGDAVQLRQVLMNLIVNGVEAVPEGRVAHIRVATGTDTFAGDFLGEALPAGRYAYLRVEDDGVGLTEETRRRMFEPFFSTKFLGRGLGLASVLGIVKAHGGALRVFSEPGRGTTVWMLLPVDPQAEAPAPRDPATLGRVLIVDDEDCVRRTMVRMVQKLGYDTVEAASGREGVEMFERYKSDLKAVFLDILLPDLDGREVARRLLEHRDCPRLILCSGYWGESPEGHPGPELPYLVKPFNLTSLSEALEVNA